MPDERTPAPVLGDIAAALIGTEVGLAIGGSAGAIIGAVTVPLAQLVARRDQRAIENVELLATAAAEHGGWSIEEMERLAGADDRRLALTAATVQGALGTLNEAKVRSLARILAEGIEDDALIDTRWLMAVAVQDLEAPHVRLLTAMIRRADEASHPQGTWDVSSLMRLRPRLAGGVAPIMATLTRHALTYVPSAVDAGGVGPWRVTDYAHQLLTYISAMAEGEDADGPVS